MFDSRWILDSLDLFNLGPTKKVASRVSPRVVTDDSHIYPNIYLKIWDIYFVDLYIYMCGHKPIIYINMVHKHVHLKTWR